MAQFLRPISNVTQTNFTGGFAEIDESTFSDVDFAYSAVNIIAVLEVGLSTVLTPGAGTRTIRYRLAQTNGAVVDGTGNTVNVTAALYQGTTLIATDTARTTSGTWTQYSFTPNTSTVTDWSALRLRFTTTASGGGASVRRGAGISWAEMETPDGALIANPSAAATASATLLINRSIAGAISTAATSTAAVSITHALASSQSTATTSSANLTVRVNLASSVSATANVVPGLQQIIALTATIQAVNVVVAFPIANLPVSASLTTSASSSATLRNVFYISAAVNVEATLVVTMDEVLKEVFTNSPVVVTIEGNLLLGHSMAAALTASAVSNPPLKLVKQLNQSISATVNSSAYLIQNIAVFSNLSITVTHNTTLLNASEGYIQGTINDNLGNPIQRTLYLYRRSDGVKIGETLSNLSTGAYQFVTPPAQIEYMVVVKEENEANTGNDQIRGRLIPYIGL